MSTLRTAAPSHGVFAGVSLQFLLLDEDEPPGVRTLCGRRVPAFRVVFFFVFSCFCVKRHQAGRGSTHAESLHEHVKHRGRPRRMMAIKAMHDKHLVDA